MTVPPVTSSVRRCGSYTAEYARPPGAVATASPRSPVKFVLELGQDGGHAGLSLGFGTRLREAQGRAGLGVGEKACEAVGSQKLVMGARRRRGIGSAPVRSLSAGVTECGGCFARTYLHRLARARGYRGVAGPATWRCGSGREARRCSVGRGWRVACGGPDGYLGSVFRSVWREGEEPDGPLYNCLAGAEA